MLRRHRFALIGVFLSLATPCAAVFSDVTNDAWYASYVQQATDLGIVRGYTDAQGRETGLFKPSNEVTRAEALKMAMESAGFEAPPVSSRRRFVWWQPYLDAAESSGFVLSSEFTGNINAQATRSEVAGVVARSFALTKENNCLVLTTMQNSFRDINMSNAYTECSDNLYGILKLSADHVITGDKGSHGELLGTFRPSSTINRAEAVKMVMEARKAYGVPGITIPQVAHLLWGAYAGGRVEDGAEFEKQIGTPMQIRATFVHWGNERDFPLSLAKSMNGRPLLIFWEPMDYDNPEESKTRFSYDAILRGDFDAYIKEFAASAKTYGGPVILVPFEEMNGDWFHWSVTASQSAKQKHVAAYRYLREFFRGASNVQFGWAVNNDTVPDTPENHVSNFYPGDAYVDIIGLDGFNFGEPWQTFSDVFATAFKRVRGIKKPLYLFSMASAEGSKKAEWITNALTQEIPRHPEVQGWIWFNENKERDWRVWSDSNALKAFQDALR